MVVVDWSGWAWAGWSALVAFGTLALAGVTARVTLSEPRRTARQRRYEQLVTAAANVRAVIGVVALVRAGLILEKRKPSAISAAYIRLIGPWPMRAADVMGAGGVIARAEASLELVDPLLTAPGQAAVGKYDEHWKALLNKPEEAEHMNDVIDAATELARRIEEEARALMGWRAAKRIPRKQWPRFWQKIEP